MLTDEQIEDFRQHPAVPSSSPREEVYFIEDGKILGTARIAARYNGHITVFIDRSPELLEHFKDSWGVKVLGSDTPFRFHEILGTPLPVLADEPDDWLEGISVVDTFGFDFGYTSKRYAHIDGFGKKAELDQCQQQHKGSRS